MTGCSAAPLSACAFVGVPRPGIPAGVWMRQGNVPRREDVSRVVPVNVQGSCRCCAGAILIAIRAFEEYVVFLE